MAKNGYDVYLKDCLLPVTPSKIQIKINGGNKTVKLINEGEINILKKAELTDIEFEAEIPQVQYPYAVYPSGFKDAGYFFDLFEELKTSKKPPAGKTLQNTNIKVSLEDYRITEEAKNGFDFKVKFNLKQYRDYGTKTVNIAENSKAATKKARAKSTVQPSTPIGIGSDVIVNGRLHRDSYGNGPGQTKNNYRGKINFINQKGSHPYHVTTPAGGWLGWVTADSVKGG